MQPNGTNRFEIRKPIKEDDLDGLFTDIECTIDDNVVPKGDWGSRDEVTSWLKVVRERLLSEEYASTALVAVKDNRIIGLAGFPSSRGRVWIRLVHVLSEYKGQGIEDILLKEAVRRLKGSHVSSINYNPGIKPRAEPLTTFRSEGFRTSTRAHMEVNVESCARSITMPEGYIVKNWDLGLVDDFALLLNTIFNEPHLDAIFVPEWATVEDAKESLKKEAESIDPKTTLLLYHEDVAFGVSLCNLWKESWKGISDEELGKLPTGFVGALGLLREYRGRGLGELLMRRVLKGFADEGVKYVRLVPTVENVPAFNLYMKLGFEEIKERTFVHFWTTYDCVV